MLSGDNEEKLKIIKNWKRERDALTAEIMFRYWIKLPICDFDFYRDSEYTLNEEVKRLKNRLEQFQAWKTQRKDREWIFDKDNHKIVFAKFVCFFQFLNSNSSLIRLFFLSSYLFKIFLSSSSLIFLSSSSLIFFYDLPPFFFFHLLSHDGCWTSPIIKWKWSLEWIYHLKYLFQSLSPFSRQITISSYPTNKQTHQTNQTDKKWHEIKVEDEISIELVNENHKSDQIKTHKSIISKIIS